MADLFIVADIEEGEQDGHRGAAVGENVKVVQGFVEIGLEHSHRAQIDVHYQG